MHKIFGEKENIEYYTRKGAYLIAVNDGKIAVVKTEKGLFLPGGGTEENETDEEWENMQYLRMKDIETILMLIKLKFSKEIGIESHLIQYDEYSVNVRNNENERKVVYE